MSDELLSLARMARTLGVTQQWLKGAAERGDVPSLKAGARFLFNAAAVKQALAEQAAETRSRATEGSRHE